MTSCIKSIHVALFHDLAHHGGMTASSTASAKRASSGSRSIQAGKNAKKRQAPRRTTVALSADAMAIVKRFQEATGLSMSEAISELIERTEDRPPRIRYVDGFPTADIPMDGKWITNEDVLRAQAELG
jgi:hypothetical protein